MSLNDDITDFPFLDRQFRRVRAENLEMLCDLLGYGSSMKDNELNSPTSFLVRKMVDCFCCGTKCLRYEIMYNSGNTRIMMQFRPGKEFREYVYGNGFGKSLVTFENNQIIHIQRGKREIRNVYEFYDRTALMTTTVEHVTVKRYYDEEDNPWTRGHTY